MAAGRKVIPSLFIAKDDYYGGMWREFEEKEILYLIALELRAHRTGKQEEVDEFWKYFIREDQ